MKRFLLLTALLTAVPSVGAETCTDLQSAFGEYRTAVSQGTDVARYFSRRYLEYQVDGLLADGDEAVLHNAKAARKQVVIAPIARLDYQLTTYCSATEGSMVLSFPRDNIRSLSLGYILEGGAWRIDGLEINLTPVAVDGT
ncbi:MAG: hypothetical protein U1A22_05275 [Xanthomonadaceae bacterium]|nr:hypothetical protein [Xanthomonadaceae bacterium]